MSEESAFYDIGDLGTVGDEIGKGGQASVFELPDLAGPPLLLKKYFSGIEINDDGLDALVSWRLDLSEDDRAYLDARTCWPRARVLEKNKTIGVLIGRAPDVFVTTLKSGKAKLRELQYLFLIDRSTKIGVGIPEAHHRALVIHEFASLLHFLQQHDIVHGDLSMKNVLWADPSEHDPSLYVLDCDGAQVRDINPPLPHVTTPGWTDPRMVQSEISSPDADSDRYALGLSFYRCYYGQLGTLDAESTKLRLPTWPPVTNDMMQLTARTLSHRAGRPSPEEWTSALTLLHAELDDDSTALGATYRQGPTNTSDAPAGSAPKSESGDTIPTRYQVPAPPGSKDDQPQTPSAAPSQPVTPQPATKTKTPATSAGNGAKVFFAVSVGLLIGALIALIIVNSNTGTEPVPEPNPLDGEESLIVVHELADPGGIHALSL